MTKRGRVLRDTNIGPGLLTVDGKQYSFLLEGMWRSDVPPRPGMAVDVGFDTNGAPAEVYAVSEAQIAKKQAQKALGGALLKGESVRSNLTAHFGVPAIAAEIIMLLSFFALPNLRLEGTFGSRPFSGWDAIGLNPATQMPSGAGFESVLAIACLFAPVAVPFVKQAWARWLNAAPLGFALLTFLVFASEIHSASAATNSMGEAFGGAAGRQMARQFGPHYNVAIGAYLGIACAIYLATRAFRTTDKSASQFYLNFKQENRNALHLKDHQLCPTPAGTFFACLLPPYPRIGSRGHCCFVQLGSSGLGARLPESSRSLGKRERRWTVHGFGGVGLQVAFQQSRLRHRVPPHASWPMGTGSVQLQPDRGAARPT